MVFGSNTCGIHILHEPRCKNLTPAKKKDKKKMHMSGDSVILRFPPSLRVIGPACTCRKQWHVALGFDDFRRQKKKKN